MSLAATKQRLDIHLDLVGGIAGDMFIAALAHALPQHEACVAQAINALKDFSPVTIAFVAHNDDVLTGKRFAVSRVMNNACSPAVGGSSAGHTHVTWRSIRDALDQSSLMPAVREHAIGIFSLLAGAEAAVHGCEAEAVTFHEVGAWDSIADIVGAAALIVAVNARRWTASPAPLGSGRVRTEHGILPVPAPATTRLLLGMPTLDDGIAGERVTPTGAAILRYLCGPSTQIASYTVSTRVLSACGHGFGTKRLQGLSNHLRALCFTPEDSGRVEHRKLHIVEFDVDDQAGEDLAMGLDRLRQHPAILDVTQTALTAKKNRLASLVRMLVRTSLLDAAVESCFRETTTIGLRHYPAEGIALKRHMQVVEVDGHSLRVKIVERPGGRTAKTESDDVLDQQSHGARSMLRQRAEALALAACRSDPDA